MLFSMGLGSRISRVFEKQLFEKFIYTEFILSILVGFSSLITYLISSYTASTGVLIYAMSIIIGILIGMEIPLAVRINDRYESLRTNISSILENDYYGSLLGGMFFAFVGLPFLGLTYTPFILGFVNFIIAILLFVSFINEFKSRKIIYLASVVVFLVLTSGVFIAEPVILFGEQVKYKDKIILSKQSAYQKIIVTQWKNSYWLYLNGNQQLCSYDEVLYHEPIVHPAMKLHPYPQDILVLGGGDGCAVREVLKYPSVKSITLVDLDSVMTNIGKHHPIFIEMNEAALQNSKVNIINDDAYRFIETTYQFYDVIIIDLPDPKTVELCRLYSTEFYSQCRKQLRPHGVIVTQAGSPYFATNAFLCIEKTLQYSGFATAKLHNQLVTLGEWGWIIGQKHDNDSLVLKPKLQAMNFDDINTEWINNEAMKLMTSFGKDIYVNDYPDSILVNRVHDPVLQRYYLRGNWDLY